MHCICGHICTWEPSHLILLCVTEQSFESTIYMYCTCTVYNGNWLTRNSGCTNFSSC